MGIGDRIKELRERLSMSQAELAQAVNVSQPTVANWETGRNNPGRSRILKISEILKSNQNYIEFGITAEQLDGYEELALPIQRVPVVSWVSATDFVDINDPYQPGAAEEWVSVALKSKTLIALRVLNDSVDKEFPPGTVVIVDYSARDLVDGKFYVFRHEGKATLKRYRRQPERLEPYSTNPKHQTIVPEGAVEVVGQVIESHRKH